MAAVNHGEVQFTGNVRTVTSTVVSYDPDADTSRFTKVTIVSNAQPAGHKAQEAATKPAQTEKA
jgi:hypothetical protein